MDKKEGQKVDMKFLQGACEDVLFYLGMDIKREGLVDTPKRMAKALAEMTEGYRIDEKEILDRTFEEDHDEIVIVKNISITSLCEHHLLPFTGVAHVAYIPDGKVLGLSKIVRLLRVYSKRLQLQERLTSQVADTLMASLKPKGVGVIIQAQHLCMGVRGVKDMDAATVTSAMRGVFLKAEEGKDPKGEMLRLIYG